MGEEGGGVGGGDEEGVRLLARVGETSRKFIRMYQYCCTGVGRFRKTSERKVEHAPCAVVVRRTGPEVLPSIVSSLFYK